MRALALAGLLTLCACGNGEVTLTTTPEALKLSGGARIRATLSNGTSRAVEYNLCITWFEQESGDAWSRVASTRVCTAEAYALGAYGSTSSDVPIEFSMGAGTFRAVTGVSLGCADGCTFTEIKSPPFELTH